MAERRTRRGFFEAAGTCALLFASGCSGGGAKKGEKEEDISPAEDLMREHGVLNRILLIYEESLRRISANEDPKVAILSDAAGIIQHFIEGYHEKLEQDYLFPRFEKAGKLVYLVRTLQTQHEAGRRLTGEILALSNAGPQNDPEKRKSLAHLLGLFIRMYRPHEAREDTVLFPALREIVSAHELDALGEDFEKKEHELFGKEGFEGVVQKTGELEKALGLFDLDQFTPR